MKNLKLSRFIVDIIFLILMFISYLSGHVGIGLGILIIVLLRTVIKIYFHKRKAKLTNREGMKMFFGIVALLYLINVLVQHFLFNREIPLLIISLGLIVYGILYLFFSSLDLDMKPKDYHKTSKWGVIGLLGYLLCAISIAVVIIMGVYGAITIQVSLIGLAIFLVGIILLCLNYRSSKKS